MEEQRIGMMYLNNLRRRIVGAWDGLFPRGLRRSPLLPVFVIAVVVFVPALAWYLHMQGKFHTMRQSIEGQSARPDLPRPGGLDPIVLARSASADGSPQFVSMTLLPGMGMDVLQINANLPGQPNVALLDAPSLAAMADGTAGPRSGGDDLRGAIELPWAGNLGGSVTLLGTTMTINWMGHSVEVPTDPIGPVGMTRGGLLANRAVDSSTVRSDGVTATGVFRGTNFDQHWLSTSDITVSAHLGASAIDLMVLAKNTGSQPEPFGIGWQPRLILPGAGRPTAELRLPEAELLEIVNRGKDQPSGHFVPLPAEFRRFVAKPAVVGDKTLEGVLARLHTDSGAPGPTVELLDPRGGFGLRLTSLSASIRELTVFSPAGERYLSVGLQTNYEDPLGTEWSTPSDPGMVTLQPGEALEWRVRLEIFPIAH